MEPFVYRLTLAATTQDRPCVNPTQLRCAWGKPAC